MISSTLNDIFEEVEKNTVDNLETVWVESPVSFKEFNEHPDYLDSFSLSKRQYEDVEKVIGKNPKNTFSPTRAYELAVFVWSKGSGKDLVISRLFAYLSYVLLCLRNPQEYLFFADATVHMDLVNVARKGGQAKAIFFSYFVETVKKCNWFKDRYVIRDANKKVSMPSTERLKYLRKHFMDDADYTIDIGTGNVTFPKNIKAHAETSAFEGFEGYNIVASVMDEASAFRSKAEVENAKGIYKTLTTSSSSRATKRFKPLGFIISYPRQTENDLTLEKYYESFTNSAIYGSFGWAWLIKPPHLYSGQTFTFTHPRIGSALLGVDTPVSVEIPVELKQDFVDDPGDAMCKHLCVPPKVTEQWVEYVDQFWGAHKEAPDIFITQTIVKEIWDEEKQQIEKRITLQLEEFLLNVEDAKRFQYVCWMDMAEVFCDACIVIGHVEVINGIEWLIHDSTLVWRPDEMRNLKVSIKDIEKWLTEIIPSKLNMVAMGSDYWNSAGMAEVLKTRYPNIRTSGANINRDDYNLMKRFVYSGNTRIKNASIITQAIQLKNGAFKPVKPVNGLQDQIDCWVGCVKLLKGKDAAKMRNMSNAPQTSNVSDIPAAPNLFAGGSGSPIAASAGGVSGTAFEQRASSIEDVRKILGVPSNILHKPWKEGTGGNEKNQNLRLPQSTKM